MSGGLSAARLARLTRALQAYVDRGEAPGLQTAIWRRGELAHRDVIGHDAFDGDGLRPDALYRLGSLTKPIVTAAALALMEEGRLRLSDRIDRWLPELRGPRVLRDPGAALDDTTPATRPITVGDLLTHRAGLASAWLPQGPIGRAAQALLGGQAPRADIDQDAWLARLAALPLLYPPGERVVMGFCTDVLGILISRLTAMGLDELLAERIFRPLGMDDTGFWVEPSQLHRLGPAYSQAWLSGKLAVADPRDGYYSRRPALLSGGGGLVSTTEDLARFGRMLLAGGRLDGQRVLSRKTVEFMTRDFLTPEQRQRRYFDVDYWADRGLGLGVFVTDDVARRGAPTSIGQYGWRAMFGNYWFNDPSEDLCAVLMVPVRWPTAVPVISNDFECLVYQAIDD